MPVARNGRTYRVGAEPFEQQDQQKAEQEAARHVGPECRPRKVPGLGRKCLGELEPGGGAEHSSERNDREHAGFGATPDGRARRSLSGRMRHLATIFGKPLNFNATPLP